MRIGPLGRSTSSRQFRYGDAIAVATGALCAMGLVVGTFGVAQTAGASAPRKAHRVIDTTRVIGFPRLADAHASRPGSRHRSSAPRITSDPQSETVAAGSTASFSASASGSPTPTVQWRLSTNSGSSWSAVSGATSTTYSFTASSAENGYEYDAVFSNSAGKATTTAATLTVTAAPPPSAPQVTSDPQSETVAAGSTASFSASASGSPTPTVQWRLSTNSGSSWSAVSGATSTTYSFTASSAENGYEYDAVFSNSAGKATTTAATLTVTAAPPPSVESSNWSGYADTGATFSAVSSSWDVPSVSCPSGSTAYSAQWIGIDGYSSSTVEQDGTEADCLSGSASYDAWYEMYGDSAVNSGYEVELSPSSYPVSPGDAMSASVSVSGGVWTLAITDSGRWSFSTTVSYSGAAQSSAEWVVERPEVCSFSCSLASLADFGTVTFSNASATVGGSAGSISAWSDTSIEMASGSTVLAAPSALDAAGDEFTDTWQASR